MRRLLENVLLLVTVLVFLAVVRLGWDHRSGLSTWLAGSDSRVLDAFVGWLTIGGLLTVVGLLPLRRPRPGSTLRKALLATPLVAWGLVAATYLWTPLAGGRATWLDDLSAGGESFQAGVVAAHWALAASILLILTIGVVQVVSPRWQAGNPANERRSSVASSAALIGPAVVALLAAWIA